MKTNISKYLYNRWLWLIILIIVLVAVGIVNIDVQIGTNFPSEIKERFNPWETCPDTQNCSAQGVVHPIDKEAVELGKKDFTGQLEQISKKNFGLNNKINTLESNLSTLQARIHDVNDELNTEKNTLKNQQSKYAKLDALYQKTDGQLDSYKTQALTLSQQLKDKEKALKLSQSDENSKLVGLRNEVSSYENKYEKALSDLNQYKSDLSSTQKDLKNYQNLYQQSEQALMSAQVKDAQDEVLLQNANEEVSKYKKELESMKNQNVYTIMNKYSCHGCPTLNQASNYTLKECQARCDRSGNNCGGYMYDPVSKECITKKQLTPDKFEYNKNWDLGVKSKPGQTSYSLWGKPSGFKILNF